MRTLIEQSTLFLKLIAVGFGAAMFLYDKYTAAKKTKKLKQVIKKQSEVINNAASQIAKGNDTLQEYIEK